MWHDVALILHVVIAYHIRCTLSSRDKPSQYPQSCSLSSCWSGAAVACLQQRRELFAGLFSLASLAALEALAVKQECSQVPSCVALVMLCSRYVCLHLKSAMILSEIAVDGSRLCHSGTLFLSIFVFLPPLSLALCSSLVTHTYTRTYTHTQTYVIILLAAVAVVDP